MSRNFIDTYGYLVRHLITGVEAAGYWLLARHCSNHRPLYWRIT